MLHCSHLGPANSGLQKHLPEESQPPGSVPTALQPHTARENVCSALGVQDKAHGKMGLFMRFSNGHVGAVLSVQTVISSNFCTFSKMPTTPLLVFLQTLPEDSDSAVTLKLAEADCCCHPDCHYLCSLLSIFLPSKVSVSRAETVLRQFLLDLMHSDPFAEQRHTPSGPWKDRYSRWHSG